MDARDCQQGFTIVELMTVMVIVGVLAVLALPSFNETLARRRIQGQANELVTDLSYAKSEAVARNRNVVLIPGGSGACYTLATWTEPAARTGSCDCTVAPPAPRCTTPPSSTDPVELKTVTLTNAVTVATTGTFDFEPVRGFADAASAAVSNGSLTYTVQVTANGRIVPFTP